MQRRQCPSRPRWTDDRDPEAQARRLHRRSRRRRVGPCRRLVEHRVGQLFEQQRGLPRRIEADVEDLFGDPQCQRRVPVISRATSIACATCRPVAASSVTMPHCSACRASNRLPRNTRSRARPAPTVRAMRMSPPDDGRIPMSISGNPNTAAGSAIRMSAASASSSPPPRQYPVIAAIVGCGSAANSS